MNTNDPAKDYDINKFERPSVTVDVLLFTIIDNDLNILLVKRSVWPEEGKWALPGGFVPLNDSLEDTARMRLEEKVGITDVYLEQLYTFGDPKRDRRTRVITVAYFALVPSEKIKVKPTELVQDAKWFPVKKLPVLAFDHKLIVEFGVDRLKAKVGYSNIVFGLLPDKFRLSELQNYYEIILGHQLDKRNFRKKILASDLLVKTNDKEIDGAHRPALLYKFKKREVIMFD